MAEMSGFKLAPSRLNRPPASDDAVASPATKTNFVGELNFHNPTLGYILDICWISWGCLGDVLGTSKGYLNDILRISGISWGYHWDDRCPDDADQVLRQASWGYWLSQN